MISVVKLCRKETSWEGVVNFFRWYMNTDTQYSNTASFICCWYDVFASKGLEVVQNRCMGTILHRNRYPRTSEMLTQLNC